MSLHGTQTEVLPLLQHHPFLPTIVEALPPLPPTTTHGQTSFQALDRHTQPNLPTRRPKTAQTVPRSTQADRQHPRRLTRHNHSGHAIR